MTATQSSAQSTRPSADKSSVSEAKTVYGSQDVRYGGNSTGNKPMRVTGPYEERPASETDMKILTSLRKNKFSSVAYISHTTNISEKDVVDSIKYWQGKNKVLTVGGHPARYQTNKKVVAVDLDSVDQDQEPYQYGITIYYMDESRETKYMDAYSIVKKYKNYMLVGDLDQIREIEGVDDLGVEY